MITTKSPGVITAEIKMRRTVFSGAFLLVEGESDSKFWRTRCDSKNCQILICGNKQVTVQSIHSLDSKNISGALGVVDDDLDSLLGTAFLSDNLVATDTHDIETLMLQSDALEKVLVERGDTEKIAEFESAHQVSVRQALVDRCLFFGKLRYLNLKHDFGVDFKSLSPWKYFDEATWTLKKGVLISDFSDNAGITNAELEVLLESAPSSPEWNIIQGHDAVCVLRIGMKKVLSSGQCSEEQLSRELRLAYDARLFSRTQMYKYVMRWQQCRASSVLVVN